LRLLLDSPWQQRIEQIERGLRQGLAPCSAMAHVADVRVLGAIGVVELQQPVVLRRIQPRFVAAGVWVRPFGRLVYLMPPYIIEPEDLQTLTRAVTGVVTNLAHD
jgi:adenosylmethionine-8-amino-7-oxononanoate aminotransferase